MPHADQLLQPEVVLWSGAPDESRLFGPVDYFIVPFSVLWTGGLIHLLLVNFSRAGVVSWGIGILMMAAAIYLVVGRFLVKRQTNRRMRYTLTNRRAIISSRGRTSHFDLVARNPHAELTYARGHLTVAFTSDDPRTYGKLTQRLFENSGLDFNLTPGRDVRFAFFDVLDDGTLKSALDRLTADGSLKYGIA